MTILVLRGHAKLRQQGSTIIVQIPEKNKQGNKVYKTVKRIPILDLDLVVLVGSKVSLSTGVLLLLAKSNVPVAVHSIHVTTTMMPPFLQAYSETRKAQHRLIEYYPQTALEIAKKIIEAKIVGTLNLATHLAKLDKREPPDKTSILKELREDLQTATTPKQLINVEANWSKKMWTHLKQAIPERYNFQGRDPKSRDPINVAINYTYAIIYTLSTHALLAAGLDPYIGLLHRDRPGRTSLTYDYSEQFKPAAIHAVIRTARTSTITLAPDNNLDTTTLETLTRNIHRTLKKKHRTWKHTIKGYIYAKAWELRNTITKATQYKPFTYKP